MTAVADEPPDPVERAARRVRRGAGLPGGVLVFLALFLPAVRVCNDPMMPIELPLLYPPYVLGLVAAIVVGSPRVSRAACQVALAFATTVVVWFGALIHLSVADGGDDQTGALLAAGVWWLGAWAFVPALRRRRSLPRRAARGLGIAAAGSALFFGLVLAFDDTVMYGTAVAFAGCVLVGAAAAAWDREARRAEARRLERDPMPRARVA